MLSRLSNVASFTISVFVLIALHFIFSGNLRGEETVSIEIDSKALRVQVSPDLYGIFFEEINHAGEGGLYAEMIENRDFEIVNRPKGTRMLGYNLRTPSGWAQGKWFGNELHGWRLITEQSGIATYHLDKNHPLNEQNPYFMKLVVRKNGTRVGVSNNGFWGMHFQQNEMYHLSLYARTEGNSQFDLTAQLESAGGHKVYATAKIKQVGGDWKQYTCSLLPDATDANGRLTIYVEGSGTIGFDVVSLFPRKTFRNRPNGLRPDLVQMLVDLKPAFLRFPGGAIVGGLCLDNRIQWKHSIGNISQRKGTVNLWGYYTTNGLGFHEYLQLAEDLNADALWVCNPGFSDNYRGAEECRPEEVEAFVQEAMDALEYALGPVDSRWGSKRAANGHPDPFRLKYIEIGNEARGKLYDENYPQFYETIKAKYPDVTIISNQDQIPRAPVEMVDHHKYGPPGSFFKAVNQYDEADRDGPYIYVGEYGVREGVGEGNLMAALSEAAYLIGLERNSDIVRMSSYAPLFYNVNDIAWPVNMIGFDSSRVFGRSSYYVQKLFSLNRPDEVLQTRVLPEKRPQDALVYALAGVDAKNHELVIKAVNRSESAIMAEISIKTQEKLGGQVKAILLGHDNPQAENSLDYPDKIVPQEELFSLKPTKKFEYRFQPYSLTVLRLPWISGDLKSNSMSN